MSNKVNKTGYLKGSKTEDNNFNIIPSNKITMEGVEKRLIAIQLDEEGKPLGMRFMEPGEEYEFGGTYAVMEVPVYQSGGTLSVNGSVVDENQPEILLTPAQLRQAQIVQQQGAKAPNLSINKYGEYVPSVNRGHEARQAKIDRMNNPYDKARAQKELDRGVAIYEKQTGRVADIANFLDNPQNLDTERAQDLMQSQQQAKTSEQLQKLEDIQNRQSGGPYFAPPVEASLEGAPMDNNISFSQPIDLNQISLEADEFAQEQETLELEQFVNDFSNTQMDDSGQVLDNYLSEFAESSNQELEQELDQQGAQSANGSFEQSGEGPIQFFNPYGGVDIPTAATTLGQGIADKDALGIIASSAKLVTGLGRNVVGGIATQKRNQRAQQNYLKSLRELPNAQSLQQGGTADDEYVNITETGAVEYIDPEMYADNLALQKFMELNPDYVGSEVKQGFNIGPYGSGDRDYFKIREVGNTVTLTPTGTNPHSPASMKEVVNKIRRNNPEYNIKLNLQSGGSMNRAQLLTGEYMMGIDPDNELFSQTNAEIEKGEYFASAQGDIAEVKGKSHKQGGENVIMEQGDRVLTDHTKLGATNAKKIRDEYDVKVKAKNTYSDVLDKFRTKSGLGKLVKEEEMILKKLEDQSEMDNGATKDLNTKFLQDQLREINEKKEPLETARKALYDKIYEMQEMNKPATDRDPMFNKGGYYQDGGAFEFLQNRFLDDRELGLTETQRETTTGQPTSTSSRVGNFGFPIAEEQARLDQLRQNFPSQFDNVFEKDDQGVYRIIPGTDGQIKGRVLSLQKAINKNYEDLLTEVGPTLSDEEKKQFEKGIKDRMFTEDGKVARLFDDKVGLFTSTRTNVRLPFGNPEDIQKLKDAGITTRSQLYDTNGKLKPEVQSLNLKPETLSSIDRTKDFKSDFLLGDFTLPAEDTVEQITDSGVNVDAGNVGAANALGILALPDQYPMIPEGTQVVGKHRRRYDRVEAPQIDPTPYLQSVRDQAQVATRQTEGLSPNVQAAANANIQANTQKALSDALLKIDTSNIQSLANAEQINAQIQQREEDARVMDDLSFEKRQLTAEAKTDLAMQEYFDKIQQVNLGNFRTVNAINDANARYDNVQFTGDGYVVRKAPDFSNTLDAAQLARAAQMLEEYEKQKNNK
jgi:hypothetical protein